MRKANYDKAPATAVDGICQRGWSSILCRLREECAAKRLQQPHVVVVVEEYQGVYHQALEQQWQAFGADRLIDAASLMKPEAEIAAMTAHWLTDDRLFGRRASLSYTDYFDAEQVAACRQSLSEGEGITLIYGHGAAYVVPEGDLLLYVDMARWEIQQRFRRGEICGLGVDNSSDEPSIHYKRGYFIDWNVCDNLKRTLLTKVDYWLDTHQPATPKMISGATWRKGLEMTVATPFRVVPFFDPAPWGGQWMKEVCDLDREKANYGWCFDCVPEENSLYLRVDGELFEMPSNNLVFYQTRALLGAPVEARFGQDFPIRFDFLDTMGGGNLSLQVHPVTQYIRDQFGMIYTQDESYYLLDAEEGASVYLGLKTGVDPEAMIAALKEAQQTGEMFDVERYINKWPAKRHDHFLIPAGTVHCSGSEAMVLEISATPSLFTFKLWDWGRLGLDGRPRPINIDHGAQVIQWERQTEWVKRELVNRVEVVAEGDDWREERTGLHENEFIETRRHWFSGTVLHETGDSVNVLNVVKGDELIVESPSGAFAPFHVHYAETFIVPAAVGQYTIRPAYDTGGKFCGTIKAYVRFKQ